MPVTLPRESDGNMRRDGSDVVWLLQPSDEKSAVDERGRVHGAPELSPVKELLAAEKFRVDYRARSERRRCRSSRPKCPRLRGQDKNREVRRGRTVEERRPIRDFTQGARKHDSLPIHATRWTFKTMRTSCAWRCPLNEVVRAAPDGLQTPSHDRLARRCRTGRGPVKARAARDAAMPACGLDCRRAGPADWPPSGHGLP
jgi:hypothetical protein